MGGKQFSSSLRPSFGDKGSLTSTSTPKVESFEDMSGAQFSESMKASSKVPPYLDSTLSPTFGEKGPMKKVAGDFMMSESEEDDSGLYQEPGSKSKGVAKKVAKPQFGENSVRMKTINDFRAGNMVNSKNLRYLHAEVTGVPSVRSDGLKKKRKRAAGNNRDDNIGDSYDVGDPRIVDDAVYDEFTMSLKENLNKEQQLAVFGYTFDDGNWGQEGESSEQKVALDFAAFTEQVGDDGLLLTRSWKDQDGNVTFVHPDHPDMPTAHNNVKKAQSKTKETEPSAKDRNGRYVGRQITIWQRPRMMEKLILNMQFELHRQGVKIPWDRIAHRLSPGAGGPSIMQHLHKTRELLITEGHMIPPAMGKANETVNKFIRGYVHDDNFEERTAARILTWGEEYENAKKSFDTGVVRGSGQYRKVTGAKPSNKKQGPQDSPQLAAHADDTTTDDAFAFSTPVAQADNVKKVRARRSNTNKETPKKRAKTKHFSEEDDFAIDGEEEYGGASSTRKTLGHTYDEYTPDAGVEKAFPVARERLARSVKAKVDVKVADGFSSDILMAGQAAMVSPILERNLQQLAYGGLQARHQQVSAGFFHSFDKSPNAFDASGHGIYQHQSFFTQNSPFEPHTSFNESPYAYKAGKVGIDVDEHGDELIFDEHDY